MIIEDQKKVISIDKNQNKKSYFNELLNYIF